MPLYPISTLTKWGIHYLINQKKQGHRTGQFWWEYANKTKLEYGPNDIENWRGNQWWEGANLIRLDGAKVRQDLRKEYKQSTRAY